MAINRNNNTIQNLNAFSDIVWFAFDDLRKICQHDHRIFDELFMERENPYRQFRTFLTNAHNRAVTVLISGSSGVGKTTFIHKLFNDYKTIETRNLYPILVDYREVIPRSTEGCLISFIMKMEEYFLSINKPIHTLRQIVNENINYNFNAIKQHLDSISQREISKHLLLFLDDFDYAEDNWFELLNYFLPFTETNKVSVVLSARPPLKAAIRSYDDRLRHRYIKDVQHIDLDPLNPEDLIIKRLYPLIKEIENESFVRRWMNKFWPSVLSRVMRNAGITDLDSLGDFRYPMTKNYNAFMIRITNGDIREMFEIALDTFLYIFKDYGPRSRGLSVLNVFFYKGNFIP